MRYYRSRNFLKERYTLIYYTSRRLPTADITKKFLNRYVRVIIHNDSKNYEDEITFYDTVSNNIEEVPPIINYVASKILKNTYLISNDAYKKVKAELVKDFIFKFIILCFLTGTFYYRYKQLGGD